MKKSDLTYIAGLFDGEGYCGVVPYQATKNGKTYYRIQATITNTDRRGLDFVKSVLGFGWVGLDVKKRENRKAIYRFRVGAQQARKFLKLIRPYVKIKGEQIDGVIV